MSPPIDRRATVVAAPSNRDAAGNAPQSLVDMMYEGFYGLFLLKNGNLPLQLDAFGNSMARFLAEVDKKAKSLDLSNEDVQSAKFAFCAAVDEVVLRTSHSQRNSWATFPLQMRVFGDQHAGDHFFQRLDELRSRGAKHLQTLEVYHLCLLLGFQGRYVVGGDNDKVSSIGARLGDEIARMRGKTPGFAPHALPPDQITNRLRSDLSIWIFLGIFALADLGAFLGFRAYNRHETEKMLAHYHDIVKMPPRAANVMITLP